MSKKKAEESVAPSGLMTDADVLYLPKVDGQSFTQAQIPWVRIEQHPDFPNSRESLGDVRGLEAGIDELGLESPIVVWRQVEEGEPDRFFLISGFRRHHALQNLAAEDPVGFNNVFPRIPVHIFEGKVDDAMFHNLSENSNRSNPNMVEFGLYVDRLIARGHRQAEIAERVGRSKGWVSGCRKFATSKEVHPDTRMAIRNGVIDYNMGYRLSRKPLKDQQAFISELTALIKEFGEDAPEVREKKKSAKAAATTTKPRGRLALRRQLALISEMDLSEHDRALDTLWDGLDKDDRSLLALVMEMVHYFGVIKGLTYADGFDIDWEKSRPPFVIEPDALDITTVVSEDGATSTPYVPPKEAKEA